MKSTGQFVVCDLDFHEAPARIAGLLKYKKHEWIVFAFIAHKRVVRLWWNKGPDGTCVWPLLHDAALENTIQSLGVQAIAVLHNHPNPDPSRFRMTSPSQADLRTAAFRHERFVSKGVSMLEFICERGSPHLYYAAFANGVVPIEPILTQIDSVNDTGIFANYALRKELARCAPGNEILGHA